MSVGIENMISGKRVLFVPVYSARSYETGVYNLALDGNMARIISKLITSDFEHAVVLIPGAYSGLYTMCLQMARHGKNGNHVRFVRCGCYGVNAHETRMNGDKFVEFINEHFKPDEFNVVVVEPNTLANQVDKLDLSKTAEMVYWCVASVTSKGTPWFVKEFEDMDKQIAQKVKTECVLQSQADALGGLSFSNPKGFYDPAAFDYATIFFPFRLSDKGYHAREFRQAIYDLPQEYRDKIKVLYTDVNDSQIFADDSTFVKVPSQKEVYIGILKGKPIIPYLDDSRMITHINIHEFMYYGCDMIMLWNTTYSSCDNVTMIDNIGQLTEALKRRIERYAK